MPAGQPTLYRPEYCQQLIDTMSQGDTLACFCADIGIHRESAYEWMKKHPEFSNAYKKAQENALKFWEKMLARCSLGIPVKIGGKEYKNYNVVAMIFLMKARFKDYQQQLVIQQKEIDYAEPDTLASFSEDEAQGES
jgi:hypothetical protein